MTINLKTGYNGHSMEFNAEPLEVRGNTLKLQVAEAGKGYLIMWTHKNDYLEATGARFEHVSLAEAAWLLAGFHQPMYSGGVYDKNPR